MPVTFGDDAFDHRKIFQPEFFMPTLIISGLAQAFAQNPRSSKPITDPKTLMRFHGLVSEEACADIFDEPELNALGLSGGRLRFAFH